MRIMKVRSSFLLAAGALAAVMCIANLSLAAESNMPSPQAAYGGAIRDAEPKGKGTGERFCWRAAYHMGQFVQGYKAYQDTTWLDWGVKYYDWCVDKMMTGPDGYKGWIGPARNGMWYDVHVGDAILLERMLAFSEVVLKDPELKKKYGEAANRYVQIGKRDLIEKWDKRGTWREDGEYGCYVANDRACEPEKLSVWVKVTQGVDEPPGRTLPFNKQNEMAVACLRLYRITGEDFYPGITGSHSAPGTWTWKGRPSAIGLACTRTGTTRLGRLARSPRLTTPASSSRPWTSNGSSTPISG